MRFWISLLILLQCLWGLQSVEIYGHILPWYETEDSQDEGHMWGIHWTMGTCSPDDFEHGKQAICSYYHPDRDVYASSDPDVIDWQLNMMKISGFSGIFIRWPGTYQIFDYPKNVKNAEAIIEGLNRNEMKFAIVYDDVKLHEGGVIDIITQGKADMNYIRDKYFSNEKYVQVDGAPLLLVNGPDYLKKPEQWDQILSELDPKPTLITKWYQSKRAGANAKGEYAWIDERHVDALNDWYDNVNVSVKIGVAYPGFNPYYDLGGWASPGFRIPFGPDTFWTTLSLAVDRTDIVQIATWNDYGEGTVTEVTREFGRQFTDMVWAKSGSKYALTDADEVDNIYILRKQHANNATMLKILADRHYALIHKFD